MKRTKGYYLSRLILLVFTELLWITFLLSLNLKLFSFSYLSIFLYTVELLACMPLFWGSLTAETNHFISILKH